MKRSIRLATLLLVLSASQLSTASVSRSNQAEKDRQKSASDSVCPQKVAGSFTEASPEKSQQRVSNYLAEAKKPATSSARGPGKTVR